MSPGCYFVPSPSGAYGFEPQRRNPHGCWIIIFPLADLFSRTIQNTPYLRPTERQAQKQQVPETA
jgi:hypothetical protein